MIYLHRSSSPQNRRRAGALSLLGVLLVTGGCLSLPAAQAGILSDLRDSIRSMWGRRAARHTSAQTARARANVLQSRAVALHERLEQTQQSLGRATESYENYWRQMRRTEANFVRTRHRVQLVTQRYNRRRILFGRRLSALQRSGRLGYLQLFLGSRTLSDLTRRTYLFNTLTSRDAELQSQLRQDKQELVETKNQLMAQWDERNRLQRATNRERERIASEWQQQARMLRQINSSRQEALAYAAVEEQSANELVGMINGLAARRASIVASYEEEARRRSYNPTRADDYGPRPYRSYRRFGRRRVARRVHRVRYVRNGGGELKPMPITEIVYHDEMVPEEGGSLSEGFSTEGDDDGWGAPVGGRISSRYGMRYHPILRRRKLHTGDDLAASYGTPIKAAHGGRVLWSGWKKAYGNTIIVDDGNGTTTLYGHASKVGVRAGQPIRRGDYIGNVGSTGWSTGPHLHFEVRKNGKPIDPTPYLHRRRR